MDPRQGESDLLGEGRTGLGNSQSRGGGGGRDEGSGDRTGLWQETRKDLVVPRTAKHLGQQAEDFVVNAHKRVGAYSTRAK